MHTHPFLFLLLIDVPCNLFASISRGKFQCRLFEESCDADSILDMEASIFCGYLNYLTDEFVLQDFYPKLYFNPFVFQFHKFLKCISQNYFLFSSMVLALLLFRIV